MKNKLMPLTLGFALLLGGAGSASAGLIDRGDGMIYDDDLNITWLADANYAQTSGYDVDGLMSWSAANAWADQLVITDTNGVDYSDWRLFNADPSDTNCTDSIAPSGFATQHFGYNCAGNELGHLFYDELGVTAGNSISDSTDPGLALFSNVQSSVYWSGTDFAPDTSQAWLFITNDGRQNITNKDNELYAWAVRSGDVAISSVPEPGTMFLLAAGMIGIAGVKWRRC
ncbi:MAG TPA: DUF1566 domain-containing protein [Gammaproteobacteria bacterium]|nr:DUF1566 domain-containing protein [Gammaproteobacteria bacterium]